jgi:hypothetical protein
MFDTYQVPTCDDGSGAVIALPTEKTINKSSRSS